MNRKQFASHQKSSHENFPNIKALAIRGLTADAINTKATDKSKIADNVA